MALTLSGSPTGPVYSLGLITVTTAGTPVLLSSAGVSLTSGFGTAANPSPICCLKIRVHPLSSNTGRFYLVFKGGNKGTSYNVALVAEPGITEELAFPQLSNGLLLTSYNADADVSGNAAYVTAIIA
jgi:hypothetical protein